jgi:hypothetical protein
MSLSFGLSYRFLDISYGFTPGFLNPPQKEKNTGESDAYQFGTSLSMFRFKLSFDVGKVKGFYLKNSDEFLRSGLPDSPYVVYPDLTVNTLGFMLRYNVNRKFSTAALTGGTQIQRKSAWSFLPTLQFAKYRFHNDSETGGVRNEYTRSTDLNLLLPLAGTWVISKKFSASIVVGPSLGVDFYKSASIDDAGIENTSKGTKAITGYTLQSAFGFNSGRFFTGFETRFRSYGHKIEDLSRLIKQYSYFQVYIGWRLRAPEFAKKTLDWINKISPVEFD